jgi:hypothetical protein
MSLLVDSEPFCGIWPASGCARNGSAYERPTLELRTSGNECSSSHIGWSTPSSHDGSRPGADLASTQGRNLNREAATWSTPNTPIGGQVLSESDTANRGATDQGKRQVGLEMESRYWATPTAHERTFDPREVASGIQLANQAADWSTPRTEDGESAGNHPGAQDSLTGQTRMGTRPLNEQVMNWPTPTVGSPQSMGERDGTNANRTAVTSLQVLATSHQSSSPAQGWGRLALSMTSSNFTSEALAELGTAIKQNCETPSDGANCWCGTPGCDRRSHKRKLNPIFAAALMLWPPWWCTSEPLPYAPQAMESFHFNLRLRLRNLLGG